jgi:hypothetical protein
MEELLHRKNITPAGIGIRKQVVNAIAIGIGIGAAICIEIRSHDQPTGLGIEASHRSIPIPLPIPIPIPTPRGTSIRPAVRSMPKPHCAGVVEHF